MAAALLLVAPVGYGCSPLLPLYRSSGVSPEMDAVCPDALEETGGTPVLREETSRTPDIRPVGFSAPPPGKPGKEEKREPIPSAPVVPPASADYPVDLPTALGLAGAENPTIALAQEAVRAGLAEQLQADALLLPSLQAGVSVNVHRGTLLSAEGIVRDVDRQSLYAGFGAMAVGGGTVAVPGLRLTAQVADAIYEPVVARNRVTGRQFDAVAVSNAVLLDVTTHYFDLLGAEARLLTIRESEGDVAEVVRLTQNFAKAGQGREGDANRARTEALLLHSTAQRVEEEIAVAAAELSRLLHMDTAVRLRGGDSLAPVTLVDPAISLDTLIQTAVENRPEVAARTADVALAEARLRQERVRPFVPLLSVGASYGAFGGGSNLADTSFGHFSGRTDFDALAVWTFQNFGFGNVALQRGRRSQVGEALARRAIAIDEVRREVAEARALCEARRLEIDTARRRVESASRAYQQDMKRARNLQGRPIELLGSANQLAAARQDLIRFLVEYDQAEFRLFVALGQPPTLADAACAKCAAK
jgi:outer membrane protein TolC